MEQRALGGQGLRVSAMGLGCMGMSEFYGARRGASRSPPSIARSSSGSTSSTPPTCTARSPTRSWSGKAIRGRRDEVVVATKFGNVRGADGAFLGINGRPDYVRQACEAIAAAARRRRHRPLLPAPRRPEDADRGDGGRDGRAGAARARCATSGCPRRRRQTIRRAHAVHPISALQTEYSLWSRDPEDEILPTVRELGIGFVAYSPLGRGFLTGRIKSLDDLDPGDYRRRSPALPGRELPEEPGPRDAHRRDRRARRRCTPSQLALAWVLAPRRRHRAHPRHQARALPGGERRGALDVELAADDLRRIDEVAPAGWPRATAIRT